jgi:chromosome partitioning protein
MFTIVLHTPKGGSGKSTLAREIAASATKDGLQTALVDLDEQGTTKGWYRRRVAPAPTLVAFKPERMPTQIGVLSAAGVELLVVDTPPAQPPYIRELLALADLVLVPVRPTADDLLAAAPIAKSLTGHKDWAFVLSQVPPRTRLLASAVRQLASIGRVAPVQLTFRADYPAAAIDGTTAAEMSGKAAEESAALYAWIKSRMEESA